MPNITPELTNVRKARRASESARSRAEDAKAVLRQAVSDAIAAGHSESALATEAGVDRMTIRKWLGKDKKETT